MKKGKIVLLIIIPLIIITLIVTGGLVYLKYINSPRKIFKTTISRTFDYIKSSQKKYNTIKEKIELTANIESKDALVQEINNALSSSKIEYNSQLDMNNHISYQNLNATYDGENLLDLDIIFQDKKIYMYFKEWFNKYIEITGDESNQEELTSKFESINSINNDLLLKGIETELLNLLDEQKITSQKITMQLDGKETKVTRSSLTLDNKEIETLSNTLLNNLKNNNDFVLGLGDNKDEFFQLLDNVKATYSSNKSLQQTSNPEESITISIYTKGMFNELVAIDLIEYNKNTNAEKMGMALIKESPNKSQFYSYENDNGQKKYKIKITNEVEDNAGIMKIYLQNEEDSTLICKYKKQNDQILFEIETSDNEKTMFNMSGFIQTNEDNYSGHTLITIWQTNDVKINITIDYNVIFNEDISKIDVHNSTKYEEMTDEERQELITNIENSKLYELCSKLFLGEIYDMTNEMSNNTENIVSELEKETNKASISNGSYKIYYSVPNNCTLSTSMDFANNYVDDNINFIQVSFEDNMVEYLNSIQNASKYSPENNEINIEISNIQDYSINGKAFKYKTVKYNYTFTDSNYTDLYFVYELDENNCYVVKVETKNGNILLDEINYFLDIQVSNDIVNI